ncbi:hypothetical protein [Mesorhizobium sp. M1409]|uniref:hypothetical protein n=1 Tax=unclassified Mesorhizobium TaxID=325217 RepID=UPI00333943A5
MMTVAHRRKWNLAAPTVSASSIAIIGGGASGVLMTTSFCAIEIPTLTSSSSKSGPCLDEA